MNKISIFKLAEAFAIKYSASESSFGGKESGHLESLDYSNDSKYLSLKDFNGDFDQYLEYLKSKGSKKFPKAEEALQRDERSRGSEYPFMARRERSDNPFNYSPSRTPTQTPIQTQTCPTCGQIIPQPVSPTDGSEKKSRWPRLR